MQVSQNATHVYSRPTRSRRRDCRNRTRNVLNLEAWTRTHWFIESRQLTPYWSRWEVGLQVDLRRGLRIEGFQLDMLA